MPRYPELPEVLAAAGLPVRLEDGWRTRGSDGFSPVGVVDHHTAGGTGGGSHAELGHIVRDNLAQLYVCRDAEVHVVACGRSSHAGVGLQKVRDDCSRDIPPRGDARDVYGLVAGRGIYTMNQHYWGIEVENNGIGEAYPARQLDVLFDLNAALCRWQHWTANRCIHHRESTSRKVDMSWRGDLRGEVAARLAPPPEPPPVIGPWEPFPTAQPGGDDMVLSPQPGSPAGRFAYAVLIDQTSVGLYNGATVEGDAALFPGIRVWKPAQPNLLTGVAALPDGTGIVAAASDGGTFAAKWRR